MAFLLLDANFYFVGSLVVFGAMLFMELASQLLGISFGGKDIDVDADVDVDFDADGEFHFGDIFKWVGLGSIPILLFLALFFASFGVIGLLINQFSAQLVGYMLPPLLSGIAAFVVTLPVLNRLTRLVSRIMPKDESNVISITELVGSTAIVLGTATSNLSAPAYATDKHGVIHNFMIRSSITGAAILMNSKVTLDRYDDAGFFYATPIV